jgi:hypothetical protein
MKILLSLHKIYYFRASLRQDLPEKTPTDKSNAKKTIINFLSSVKPLKSGTNYPRWCYDVRCMYTWLPVAVPFIASWCFRLCEDPKQCSSILIWVLLEFDMLVLLLFGIVPNGNKTGSCHFTQTSVTSWI